MTTFAVTGWSVDDKKLIRETADYGQLGAELGQDVSGAELLKNAFAERDEALVVAEPLDGDDARLRATAGYLERARRFVTGTGSCSGDPRIRVGTLVTLGGLGRLFNGDYRVVRTRHCWSLDEAYTTEFDVERVGLGKVS
jgi:phage protein D